MGNSNSIYPGEDKIGSKIRSVFDSNYTAEKLISKQNWQEMKKQTNQMLCLLKLGGYTLVFCMLRDSNDKIFFQNQNCRPGETPQQVSVLASLTETQHQFQAPILGGTQLPIIFFSGGYNVLLAPAGTNMHVVHIQTSRHTHTHKINKQTNK